VKNLKLLPEIKGPTKILVALDYYDGPISGFVDISNELYYFDWYMEALEDDDTANGPRIFTLRKAPTDVQPILRIWCKRHEELISELSLLRNPHIFPISDWQKAQLPSPDYVEKILTEHDESMPQIKDLPIMGWMEEGTSEFAAIQVIHMTKEDSDYYQAWQIDVAHALRAEDQKSIDDLFSKRPESVGDNYIFKVYIDNGNGSARAVLRDHKGQPLPPDFWMTSKHSTQDLTHLKSHI